jgi:hypothetical protein
LGPIRQAGATLPRGRPVLPVPHRLQEPGDLHGEDSLNKHDERFREDGRKAWDEVPAAAA